MYSLLFLAFSIVQLSLVSKSTYSKSAVISGIIELVYVTLWVAGSQLNIFGRLAVRSNFFGFSHTILILIHGLNFWLIIDLYYDEMINDGNSEMFVHYF